MVVRVTPECGLARKWFVRTSEGRVVKKMWWKSLLGSVYSVFDGSYVVGLELSTLKQR